MLIGIVSDTHEELDRLKRSVDELQQRGVDYLFHCGDLMTREVVSICSQIDCSFVFGNHDSDSVPELKQAADDFDVNCLGWGGIVELDDKQIAVAHGHMTMDIKPLLSQAPNYLLTGHTHESRIWKEGNVIRINPGALHRAKVFSFAILDTHTSNVDVIPIAP